MESSPNAPINHVFNLAQNRFFQPVNSQKPRRKWSTCRPFACRPVAGNPFVIIIKSIFELSLLKRPKERGEGGEVKLRGDTLIDKHR